MKLNKIMAELRKYGEVEFPDANGDYYTIRERIEIKKGIYYYTEKYMAFNRKESIFQDYLSWKETKNWVKEKLSSK